MQGLELMVRLRGGVRALGMKGTLADLLYWFVPLCSIKLKVSCI